MQFRVLATILLAALPSIAAAQTSHFVLPAGSEGSQSEAYDDSWLGMAGSDLLGVRPNVPIHVQNTFALAEVPVSAAKVVGLAMRRNNWYSFQMYASSTDVAIHMSTSTVAPDKPSATFAANEGANRRQVFGANGKPGRLDWPAADFVANGYQPLPFTLQIPLSSPYVLITVNDKALCLDYLITRRTSTSPWGAQRLEASLCLDAEAKDPGTRFENGGWQLACLFSDNSAQAKIAMDLGGLNELGGTWWVSYAVPANVPGVATLSAYGVDTPGNPFNNPIDLAPLGAPGCKWMVGLETGFWVALKPGVGWNQPYLQWPAVTIPPGLPRGFRFHEQALMLDPKANALGLVPSTSSAWKIGSTRPAAAATVGRIQDTPPSKTGKVTPNYAVVTRFTY